MVHQYLLWAHEALASEAVAIGEVAADLGAGFVRARLFGRGIYGGKNVGIFFERARRKILVESERM